MKKLCIALLCFMTGALSAANQTDTVSPVHLQNKLPFKVKIKKASFQLPNGFHSGVHAYHDGKWLLLAGRTNGLHGFNDDPDNFPPSQQNKLVYVVDPVKKRVYSRWLTSEHAGFTQEQIDYLSVTSPQHYQENGKVYMTGGYGVDSATGLMNTKPILSVIDIEGMMNWVMHRTHHKASHFVRQLSHPIFQVTGGEMFRIGNQPTLLVFGQLFNGFYSDPSQIPPVVQQYIEQVRRFHIIDNGDKLKVNVLASVPLTQDPNYRRRDLNIVPMIKKKHGKMKQMLSALSGVFTETDGAWTVPVEIAKNGHPSMENPASSKAFKQAMNNYASATCGLYSENRDEMYTLLLGGITFGFFEDGQFQTNSELPFTNQFTVLKRQHSGHYKQYLMGEYPTILSTQSNPGNPLLFGAGAAFFPQEGAPLYSNHVFKFDKLGSKKQRIGYIVGGIASTLANTNTMSDSTASPYIFEVILTPR